MYLQKLKSHSSSIVLVTVLTAVSILLTYLVVNVGVEVAPLVVLGMLAVFGLIWMLKDYTVSIYLIFILAVFMSYINRMIGGKVIPLGVVLDGAAAVAFLAMFLTKEKRDWSALKSPVTYLFSLVMIYQLLQVFNPNSHSFEGWAVSMRGNTSFLLYFVFFAMFVSMREIKRFTLVWIVLASIIALYGIWQELFGLNAQEMQWVHSAPGRIKLLFIWGHMRKFSLLSDPSSFGLFMGVSGLFCLVLAMGPFKPIKRLGLATLGAIMLVSMSFSGTRTAFAMVAVGVVFYLLITLRNRATIAVGAITVFAGALLLFGPFHNGTITRVRSTFNSEEDASMRVRDRKRLKAQEYIQSHPIGGGVNTTGANGLRYSPGHYLATEIGDADSGYLMTALEMGWVGLFIGLTFFCCVTLKGIQVYFALDDPYLKTLALAYMVPFMAISVAHYAQDAMFQKPVYLVIIATYALILRLPSFEKRKL